MGHVLTSTDFIWDGIHDFNTFSAKISKKRSDMPNHGLMLQENIDVEFNLKTVKTNLRMNRFLKLISVKKILKDRWIFVENTVWAKILY
jgi:hypothetical protein